MMKLYKKIKLKTDLRIVFLFLVSCIDKNDSDMILPEVVITSPQDSSVVNETVYIKCTATDNEGIKKVELWIDSTNNSIIDEEYPYVLKWNTNNYKDGTYKIFIRAFDVNENNNDSDTLTLKVDPQCLNFLGHESSLK